jgi:dihydrofolate reductase
MQQVRYCVAASLNGYIAGPKGEADWIVMDPDIDFNAIWGQFDTFLTGRKTFETMAHAGGGGSSPGMKTLVFSRTLKPSDHPKVTIVADNVKKTMTALKKEPGKDIWLFGGGSLFASLLAKKLVDTIEVAIVPILLGGGIPLLPPPAKRAKLNLIRKKTYQKTGIVSLEYAVK